MKTAKGLHLWLADFGPLEEGLWITTKLRAPLVALRRAQQVAKELQFRGVFRKIEHKGTIDA